MSIGAQSAWGSGAIGILTSRVLISPAHVRAAVILLDPKPA
jgi:hypothetical protein